VLTYIKKHIDIFPVVDLHYTRQNTTKQYLESGLSIANMSLNHFYLEWALSETNNVMAQNVTLRQFSDVFNQLYNLRFFKPKRDLCDQY